MILFARLFRLRSWTCLFILLFFLPFDILVGLSLFLSDIFYLLLKPFLSQRAFTPSPRVNIEKASIVVLNWEGKHLLEEFLPSVVAAVKQDGRDHEILVVDNGSTDGSVEFLKIRFPGVRIVPLPRNMRFTGGNNAGIRAALNDIVIFLNNDMQVDLDFIKPLLEGFAQENVFSVSCQVFFQNKEKRREETGKTRARWKWGFLEPYHDQILTSDIRKKLVPIYWGGGGSCAFNKRMIQEIGGLDTLYDPFYLEDTDLSYQAWKRGWKSLLAVDSVVVHRHRGTNKLKFGDNYVDNTIRKNQYLFVWKNITSLPWTIQHVLFLPLTQARLLAQTTASFELKAFFRALIQLPEAILKRQRLRKTYVMDDPVIFQMTANDLPEQGQSSIDFSKSDFLEQLGKGWHNLENDGQRSFRWTALECEFFLFPQGSEETLEIRGAIPEINNYPRRCQKMSVYHNDRKIYEARWRNSEELALSIPVHVSKPGCQSFKLLLAHGFCPARVAKSDDHRELGVIIAALRLV